MPGSGRATGAAGTSASSVAASSAAASGGAYAIGSLTGGAMTSRQLRYPYLASAVLLHIRSHTLRLAPLEF